MKSRSWGRSDRFPARMVTSLGDQLQRGHWGGSWVETQAVLPLTPLSGQEQRGLGCGVRGGGEAGIQPRPWDLACLPLTPLWPPPPDASNLQAVFSGTAPGALSFLPGLEGLPLRVLWEHPS